MKKPRSPSRKVGRKRRIAGWAMLTLGVIVAGVWVASGWWIAGRSGDAGGALIGAGVLVCFHDQDVRKRDPAWDHHVPFPVAARWHAGRMMLVEGIEAPYWRWLEEPTPTKWDVAKFSVYLAWYQESDYSATPRPVIRKAWTISLWPVPLLLFATGVPILRSGLLARRRANTGACAKCGYSLAGLGADALCPECGKGAKATA